MELSKSPEGRGQSVHLHDGVINNFRPGVNTISRGVIDVFWSKLSSGKVLMITSEYIRSVAKFLGDTPTQWLRYLLFVVHGQY